MPDFGGRQNQSDGKSYLPRAKALDPLFNGINFIFECKDDCKTIITSKHLKEMERFTALAVDDPRWEQTCERMPRMPVVDGAHCSMGAYRNATQTLNPL